MAGAGSPGIAMVPAFPTERVASFVPMLTASTLRNWKSERYIQPSVINVNTRGSTSLWSVRDVVVLRLVMRIGRNSFGSVPTTIRTVDSAVPRRSEDVPSTTVLYWNGGKIHLLGPQADLPLELNESAFLTDLFAVRANVREQFAETQAAATWYDVSKLLLSPNELRGRRPKAS